MDPDIVDLPMESDILGFDIAEGSYNKIHSSDLKPIDGKKLLLRQEEEQNELTFSKEFNALEICTKRSPCLKCEKSFKFYCPDCKIPLACTESIMPKLALPILVDIIKHSHESNMKVRLTTDFDLLLNDNLLILLFRVRLFMLK